VVIANAAGNRNLFFLVFHSNQIFCVDVEKVLQNKKERTKMSDEFLRMLGIAMLVYLTGAVLYWLADQAFPLSRPLFRG